MRTDVSELVEEFLGEEPLDQDTLGAYGKCMDYVDAIERRAEALKSALRKYSSAGRGPQGELKLVRFTLSALEKSFRSGSDRVLSTLEK